MKLKEYCQNNAYLSSIAIDWIRDWAVHVCDSLDARADLDLSEQERKENDEALHRVADVYMTMNFLERLLEVE